MSNVTKCNSILTLSLLKIIENLPTIIFSKIVFLVFVTTIPVFGHETAFPQQVGRWPWHRTFFMVHDLVHVHVHDFDIMDPQKSPMPMLTTDLTPMPRPSIGFLTPP